MRMPRITALVGAIAAAALALTACSAGSPDTPDPGQTDAETAPLLTIGSLSEPTSWDPAQANEGHFAPIYQSVYDTLIKREPDGELTPMLATEWTMSDDSLSLQLELRTDVTFSDGTAFDAEAVKANIEHFKTANGPLQGNLASVSQRRGRRRRHRERARSARRTPTFLRTSPTRAATWPARPRSPRPRSPRFRWDRAPTCSTRAAPSSGRRSC